MLAQRGPQDYRAADLIPSEFGIVGTDAAIQAKLADFAGAARKNINNP